MRDEVVHCISGTTRYMYAKAMLLLEEPFIGDNHTLVYPWTLCLPEKDHEQGRSYFFYLPRGPYDDVYVRDKIACALFRMHEREMKRECTPPWKRPQKPILFERISSSDLL